MKNFILVLLVLAVIGIGVYYYRHSNPTSDGSMRPVNNAPQTGVPSAPSPTGSQTLFSGSPDANTAAVIFPGQLSDQAKTYIENFTMSTQMQSDGSTVVSLMPKGTSDEKPQTYTVKAGQKLYFVEKFTQDDTTDKDNNLKDDYGVIVDADGYIVQ